MDIQAQKFLQKTAYCLAENVSDDSQLQHLFHKVVSTLPKNHSNLKSYLLDNSVSFTTVFEGYLQERKCILKQKSPVKCDDSNKQLSIVQQILMQKEDASQLMEIIEASFQMCPDFTSKKGLANHLLMLTIALKSPIVTTCIAHGLYSCFEHELSHVKNISKTTTIEELDIFLSNALVILQKQNVSSEKVQQKNNSNLPSFRDVITALFSLYTDVTLLKSQSNNNFKETSLTGVKLLETGLVILDHDLECLLESIIQISNSKLPNSNVILKSLYKHTLLQHSWINKVLSVPLYLQFILAVRQGIVLFEPTDKKLSDHLKRFGLQVKAPEEFYKWVSNCKAGDNLLDITPLLPTTTYSSITKFFINECELDILEDFLDLYFSGQTEDPVKEDVKEEQVEESGLLAGGFFFDKTPLAVDDDLVASTDKIIKQVDDSNDVEDPSDDELLKETEYLLDSNPVLPEVKSEEANEFPCVVSEEELSQQSTVDDDVGSTTFDISPQQLPVVIVPSPKRSRTRKRVSASPSVRKSAKKTRVIKEMDASVVLSPIDERTVHDSKRSKCESKIVVVRRKERSDSESSTGSHGYMTRSRSRPSVS